jgi:hypothetical protein
MFITQLDFISAALTDQRQMLGYCLAWVEVIFNAILIRQLVYPPPKSQPTKLLKKTAWMFYSFYVINSVYVQ